MGMSLIAAFLWNKTPRCSISVMVVDSRTMEWLIPPKIYYLPKSYLRFQFTARNIIKDFFRQLKRLRKISNKPIMLEYKTVFYAHNIPYISPAKESLHVHTIFLRAYKNTNKKIKKLQLQPQLRRRLSGKALIQFKKELRTLHLVHRKKETHFEYHLWTVALHATPATYVSKLQRVRKKLLNTLMPF